MSAEEAARDLSLEQARAVVRDRMKRWRDTEEQLASARHEIDRLRALVDSRPTRAQYQLLAKKCVDLERELEKQTLMTRLARRDRG